MKKKLGKCFIFFMSAFSIFSLVRNASLKLPSTTSEDNAKALSSEVRDGDADSGFILFSLNLDSAVNKILAGH